MLIDPNVMYFTLNNLETYLLGKLDMLSLLKAGGLHGNNLPQNFFFNGS